jgi:hypothetical protein
MHGLWIWLGAALLYAGFRVWYDGWRGPLSRDEIERFLAKLAATPSGDLNDLATLRSFLERDDGREFVMLNLVRISPEPVPHPVTGEPTSAARLLREYIRQFLPLLIRRAGHPALQAAKIGPYVDAWNVEPDPGWTMMGYMRYRSRRDMLELVTHPRFTAAHPLKAAALPVTFSFPTSPGPGLLVGPRVWVGLVLGLIAALAHLGWLALA